MRVLSRALWTAFFALLFTTLATPHFALACNKTFYLYNRSDGTIVRFYVAPSSANNWEDDVLGSTSAVEPDTNKRINMSNDTRNLSMYDVRAILDDGSKVIGTKINLCRARSIYIYDDRVTYSDSD